MSDLLDEIAKAVGAAYLSDLHENADTRSCVPRALKAIPRGRYTEAQWTAAVRYILKDRTLTPETEREARALLCRNEKNYTQYGIGGIQNEQNTNR